MKMRKFADEGFVREGKNENIDDKTRAEAMASVNKDPLGDFIKSRGLDRVSVNEVANDEKVVTDDRIARTSPAAAPKAKPAIVTLKQLNAFKAKYGADKDLTDYRNAEAGGLKRRNNVNPDMGATSDKAFLDFVKNRNKPTPAAVPADVPVARSEVKNTSNDLRAKGQAQQARGARLRGETDAVLGENAQRLKADFKKSLGVKDFLESSDYAKGGVVSASRRGDGIAQRGKTRGRMC
jgi:hypothetical protein